MNKQKILKILNPVIALLFLTVISTALCRNLIPFSVYEYVHMLPGLTLGVLIPFHVFLNKSWIENTYFKKRYK
jgi:hypothetical protein